MTMYVESFGKGTAYLTLALLKLAVLFAVTWTSANLGSALLAVLIDTASKFQG